MSRCLTERSIDHVILERGEIANSWRTERWDSLRLLTPNWQCRLPGFGYAGENPDDFMAVPEVIEFIDSYAETIDAPVLTHTEVRSVSHSGNTYQVRTNGDTWRCRSLVLASGACNIPSVPGLDAHVPADIQRVPLNQYRNPGQLEAGGVLVVGASATGLQLAQEIHLSGRPVTLAVGEHVRMPRQYRGRDIQWWMDATGLLDERYDEVDDIVRARNVPSPQLVGTPEKNSLDLNKLTEMGINMVGRFAGFGCGKAQFSGSLRNVCALADLKLGRLLDTIDEWIRNQGLESEVEDAERYAPTRVEESPPLTLDFRKAGIKSIVWATGFHPDYSWLDVPVFDRKGRLRHDGGVVASPGLYVLGLTFLRRRKSSFIHGAEDDSLDLSKHMATYLAGGPVTCG